MEKFPYSDLPLALRAATFLKKVVRYNSLERLRFETDCGKVAVVLFPEQSHVEVSVHRIEDGADHLAAHFGIYGHISVDRADSIMALVDAEVCNILNNEEDEDE